jgi:hypothetical protein
MNDESVSYGTVDWLAAMNGIEVVSNAPGEATASRTFVSATAVSIVHGPSAPGDYAQRRTSDHLPS